MTGFSIRTGRDRTTRDYYDVGSIIRVRERSNISKLDDVFPSSEALAGGLALGVQSEASTLFDARMLDSFNTSSDSDIAKLARASTNSYEPSDDVGDRDRWHCEVSIMWGRG